MLPYSGNNEEHKTDSSKKLRLLLLWVEGVARTPSLTARSTPKNTDGWAYSSANGSNRILKGALFRSGTIVQGGTTPWTIVPGNYNQTTV